MNQTEADRCGLRTTVPFLPADPSTGSVALGIPWLDDFQDLLMTPAARTFVDWAAGTAGPPVVLDRGQFEPADVKPWIGDLSILQWD